MMSGCERMSSGFTTNSPPIRSPPMITERLKDSVLILVLLVIVAPVLLFAYYFDRGE